MNYTGSTFLYALYMVLYNLPKVIAPTLAGPFVDKFSRRKTIYTLDFASAALYGCFAWLIISGYFSYGYLVVGCLLLGTIDSVYQVAYDSFYPMLISEGNYTKAYSIQSTLESLTIFMVPASAFLYNAIGIVPLFLINMGSFLVAAIMETQIHQEECYVKKEEEEFGLAQYKKPFVEGVAYLRDEPGLLAVTSYFTVSFFASGALSTIVLPYFKLNYENGEYVYMFTMGWMMVLCFMEGILGVTSYNIRISATQSYVPDERKGRFNGIFQIATTVGLLLGQFLSGVFTFFLPERAVVSGFMMLSLLAAVVIMRDIRNMWKKFITGKHSGSLRLLGKMLERGIRYGKSNRIFTDDKGIR